jgi:hypothetical protein
MRNGELGGIFYRLEWYISTPIFAFIINIDIAICMPCHKEAFCIWHPCNCITSAAPPTRVLVSLLSWYEVRFIRICKHANTLVQTDLTELDYVLSAEKSTGNQTTW